MTTPNEDEFPLATENYFPDGGGPVHGVDSDAGASGSSSGGLNLSREAVIAISVVVSVVAVLGSKSPLLHDPRLPKLHGSDLE